MMPDCDGETLRPLTANPLLRHKRALADAVAHGEEVPIRSHIS